MIGEEGGEGRRACRCGGREAANEKGGEEDEKEKEGVGSRRLGWECQT